MTFINHKNNSYNFGWFPYLPPSRPLILWVPSYRFFLQQHPTPFITASSSIFNLATTKEDFPVERASSVVIRHSHQTRRVVVTEGTVPFYWSNINKLTPLCRCPTPRSLQTLTCVLKRRKRRKHRPKAGGFIKSKYRLSSGGVRPERSGVRKGDRTVPLLI